MRCIQVAILACCQAVATTGWAQQDQTGESIPSGGSILPLDVAGYLSFRHLNGNTLDERPFYQEYSGSLFLSKTIGRWRFHSEFNASNSPEFDSEGIHLFPPRPSLSLKLDNGSVNYNVFDWLQGTAGFLFIPTYWREHRYQSTTLSVDDPLIDQTIFATAFTGIMVHGDRYFREGGFSYQLYGGIDQETAFNNNVITKGVERYRALGGKVVIHMPTNRVFDTFDLGVQRLHQQDKDGTRDELYGTEIHLETHGAGMLAEFAHSSDDIVHGSRNHIRQGYYIQPSYRITRKLFAFARYDRLNLDSRFASTNRLARQLLGLTYRPVPQLSFKVDVDRDQSQAGTLPAYYGASVGVIYFFHIR